MEKKELLAKNYGILPDDNKDCSQNLKKLLDDVQKETNPVLIKFEKGIYNIFSENAQNEVFYVTNTLSEQDLKIPVHHFGIILRNLNNVDIDFNGAKFLYNGVMTHIFIDKCNNVSIKNLEIDHLRPPYCSEVKCIKKSAFSAEFIVNKDSTYKFNGKEIIFTGEDWEFSGIKDANIAGYIPKAKDGKIRRGLHPFRRSYKIEELEKGKLLVKYYLPTKVQEGATYALINTKRLESGIVINESSNISLENIKQHFNMAQALVAQSSENITIKNCEFKPDNNSNRCIASIADFMHFNMCRGNIVVEGCEVKGANDDGINVHGINFPIEKKEGNNIVVKFSHRETYGFNPFRNGDKIAFINKKTLLKEGESILQESKLIDSYRISIVLDKDYKIDTLNTVIEDLSANPNLYYKNNKLTEITTRGVLVTTRGNVEISNNVFDNLGMSGVLIADDANSWYESGQVENVKINNNDFIYCGDAGVNVNPEIKEYKESVHKNIVIEGNNIKTKDKDLAIIIKAAENISIKNNNIVGNKEQDKLIKLENTLMTDID